MSHPPRQAERSGWGETLPPREERAAARTGSAARRGGGGDGAGCGGAVRVRAKKLTAAGDAWAASREVAPRR